MFKKEDIAPLSAEQTKTLSISSPSAKREGKIFPAAVRFGIYETSLPPCKARRSIHPRLQKYENIAFVTADSQTRTSQTFSHRKKFFKQTRRSGKRPAHPSTSPHVIARHRTLSHVTARHRTSPRVTAHPRASPHIPARHRTSPHVTAHPCASPCVTARHRASPRVTAHPRASPRVIARHRTSPPTRTARHSRYLLQKIFFLCLRARKKQAPRKGTFRGAA